MGMLLYMEELKRKAHEAMEQDIIEPAMVSEPEPASEPKAEDSTETEQKTEKTARKPARRVTGRRSSK